MFASYIPRRSGVSVPLGSRYSVTCDSEYIISKIFPVISEYKKLEILFKKSKLSASRKAAKRRQ